MVISCHCDQRRRQRGPNGQGDQVVWTGAREEHAEPNSRLHHEDVDHHGGDEVLGRRVHVDHPIEDADEEDGRQRVQRDVRHHLGQEVRVRAVKAVTVLSHQHRDFPADDLRREGEM